jgi:LL-diaminopimelate aminotransferase
MRLAERLKGFHTYLGTEMNLRLTRMRSEGRDVINLGVGDPDVQPSAVQRQTLADACLNADSHHYPSFYSPKPLKEAIAAWYLGRFGVACDPESEVLPLLGSADGLFHIHTCLLDPGDIALVPDPCYPAYVAGVKIAGGRVHPVPLLKQNDFLPDLEAVPVDVARKARMIWVNYPNNPTAAVAGEGFYRRLIDWARRYEVAVISDNPYSEICFDGYRPPSLLEVEGAKEVGVEFNSLSKAFHCCGWRAGMMLGNREIIAAMDKVKSHADRGMFYPLQVAATESLKGPTEFMQTRNRALQERRDVVLSALEAMGIAAYRPKATFYVWAEVPHGAGAAREFCFKVLEAVSVWMIPGPMYGAHGEGYFRIALTHPSARLAEAMERLKGFIAGRPE